MARTLYKTIAVVLFVLVTIQYFYFYPSKNGGGLLSSTTGGGSTTSFRSVSPGFSTDASASRVPQVVWRQPHESSVFYILKMFSPPPPAEDEFTSVASSTDTLPVPQQQQQLISLLNQVNSRLNQSSSPNHLPTRLNPRFEHAQMSKVNFVDTGKRNSSSEATSNGTTLLVTNITKISENQTVITVVPPKQLTVATTTMLSSSLRNSTISLPHCPIVSPFLVGFMRVRLQAPSLADIGRNNNDLDLGGHYRPATCRARSRVAIIVPFRDREDHLRLFLHNLIPMLKRQQMEFNIFVIEQGGSSKNEPFNRAMLFNVGFVEANKRYPYWECFIFHDVDLIPENDHNLYDCPVQPRHMSVAVDKMKYKLPYKTIFGGISALTKEHFVKVNGFSNMFWYVL